MPLPIFWVFLNWPLACRRVNEVLLLLLYLSLLSWLLALDNGCSAMNSSLKATVLEYIYKWTEEGRDMRQVSELDLLSKRQTHDKLGKDICSYRSRKYHTRYTYMTDICYPNNLLLLPHCCSAGKTQNQCCHLFLWYNFSCYYLDDSKMK